MGSGANYFDQRQRTVKVSRSQLASAAKSKLDFYNILANEGQYFLPPYEECPMLFIRDLMFGRKKVSGGSFMLYDYLMTHHTAYRPSRTPTSE